MVKGDNFLRKALTEMERDNPDLNKAFEYLNKSAIEKNYEALYAIGTWYLNGRYVKKNPFLAVEYFLKSIEGNISSAYFDLAVCYEKGVGVKKNYKKGFECYLNAALLGDRQAIYEVGRCYYYGIGVSKNKKISHIWLKRAEANDMEK